MADLNYPLYFSEQSEPVTPTPIITHYLAELPLSSQRLLTATSTSTTPVSSKRLAVCFSGGPAPGGHNVVLAIAQCCAPNHHLYGVIGGPGGLICGDLIPLSLDMCLAYENKGGFDLLKTDRTKITTPEHIEAIKTVVRSYQLDAIIIIGGDDSHTNAVFLAQALLGEKCAVVGVPKTIDGDLRYPPYLPISFGFSSACDLYSKLVANLIRDTQSTQKYWHFVKLMGRSSSHITLNVAKQTHPDLYFIGEYLARDKITLSTIVANIGDYILSSAKNNKHYGVICIPEGLLEWLPDVGQLIQTLNNTIQSQQSQEIIQNLAPNQAHLFQHFPDYIQAQLLLDRDSHGNVQLSRIETERCLSEMVERYIAQKDSTLKLNAIPHFFGYEGRCTHPNDFDCKLSLALGHVAVSLALQGYTGHMASVNYSDSNIAYYGVPISRLLTLEKRHNQDVPVIKKTLVTDL